MWIINYQFIYGIVFLSVPKRFIKSFSQMSSTFQNDYFGAIEESCSRFFLCSSKKRLSILSYWIGKTCSFYYYDKWRAKAFSIWPEATNIVIYQCYLKGMLLTIVTWWRMLYSETLMGIKYVHSIPHQIFEFLFSKTQSRQEFNYS